MAKATRQSESWSSDPNHEDRTTWVDLAIDAGTESLKAQREELSGMRTRAVAFSALTVTASAFLVGRGLTIDERTATFYVLAVIGTFTFAALAVLLVWMVSPGLKFRFILRPEVLIAWMDGNAPAPSKRVASRKLAEQVLPEMLEANERSLSIVRWLYRIVLIVSLLTLGVWLSVVWIFS